MFDWLILLIGYLPFQIALNPWVWLNRLGLVPGLAFDLASLRLFIILFFVIWLGRNIIRRVWLSHLYLKNLQAISLFAFLILAVFSLIGAENFLWGLRKIIFFLSIFPLYFLVMVLVNNWLKIKKVVLILVAGAGSVALIGLGQFLAPFVFGLERVYEFWTWRIVPVFSGFNFGALIMAYPSWLVDVSGRVILRAFSLFSDPHMLSFYLGFILPLAVVSLIPYFSSVHLGQRLESGRNYGRFLVMAVFFLLFVVLLLTFTRGAYGAIIITFLFLAGLLWQSLKEKKIALLLGLSLLIFIIPISPIADRFYSSFDMSDGSNIGRLAMWQQASRVGLGRPWQGVGLGNYSLFVEPNLDYRNPITAHNFYLDIFSEMGIFTLIVWFILILGTIGQLFWRMKSSSQEQKYLCLGLIGSLVYFSAHSFFETAFYHPSILALLMVILGLSTAVIKKEELAKN